MELVERFTSSEDALAVLTKMWGKWRCPVVIDSRASAGALVPGLLQARVQVVEISTADLLRACSSFRLLVREGRLRHRGQQPLDVAVAGAAVRSVGEGWEWSRKVSTVSVSPLVAATLACWGAVAAQPRNDGWMAWE